VNEVLQELVRLPLPGRIPGLEKDPFTGLDAVSSSSSTVISRSSAISMTRARPRVASKGIVSNADASYKKCSGASI